MNKKQTQNIDVEIRDEEGNLKAEYIKKIVKDSINQNRLVYDRLAEM